MLVDSDPGRLRLRSATTTTLALVLALTASFGFITVAGQPITVAMLGTIVAMQSAAAVKDRQQRSRVVTTLLLFFPAVAAVSLAATLSHFGKVADVGFIAVLFGAVWVRRFDPGATPWEWSRSSPTSSRCSCAPRRVRYRCSPSRSR